MPNFKDSAMKVQFYAEATKTGVVETARISGFDSLSVVAGPVSTVRNTLDTEAQRTDFDRAQAEWRHSVGFETLMAEENPKVIQKALQTLQARRTVMETGIKKSASALATLTDQVAFLTVMAQVKPLTPQSQQGEAQ
jgi:hypothetical protein